MDSRLLKLFVIITTTYYTLGTDKVSLECPLGAVVTTLDGGRFGNLAWEYASVWALTKYFPCNRIPYSTIRINKFLVEFFERLSLPAIEDLPSDCECFTYNDVYTYNYQQSHFFNIGYAKKVTNCTENVILSRHAMLISTSGNTRQNYDKNYRRHFVDAAYEMMERCKAQYIADKYDDTIQVTYVAVHVRRTDYPAFLMRYNLTTVNVNYYRFCFDYFRSRTDLERSIFLVVSDDPQWVQENLISNNEYGDVFLAIRGDVSHPGYDVTLLSMCNHSVIDYGSYGYWTAMYARGETLVSNISYAYAARVLEGYTNWRFIYGKSDGRWDFL